MPIDYRCIFMCGWLALAPSVALAQTAPLQKGAWSNDAASVAIGRGQESLRVPSPDGKKAVTVGSDYIRVTDGSATLTGLEDTAIDGPAELLWAPDSKAFAITSSDTSLSGTWLVSVFSISGDTVKIQDVTSDAQDDFMALYQCTETEKPDPNIAAIAWTRDSSELLVVAQVPPLPSCTEKGKVAGYLVSVPSGQILTRFTESQLRERWSRTLSPHLAKP